MGLTKYFKDKYDSFRGPSTNANRTTKQPPINSKRVSEPDTGVVSLNSLIEELSIVNPDFQFELLDVLEHLAKYNSDVGYAIENIVTLGNTGHEVEFDSSVSDEQAKLMMESLKEFRDTWYGFSDGENAMINDMFAQLAVTGVLSAEAIPDRSLSSVENVVLVSPKGIRFVYNTKSSCFEPFQVSKRKVNTSGLIKLNVRTYKYFALRRYSGKPYGIPPFMSALENIAIEKDMVASLKHISKKLGVLGFLRVLVDSPARKPAETDEAWYKRCQHYLNEIVPEIEKSMQNGHVVGFKGTHDFEMQSVNSNVQGARELFQLNTEMKMSGLKQDPMMLGRNFNTSETLGRVMLSKLGSQVENYQKTVASYISFVYSLHLRLQGFRFKYADVKFDKPSIKDKLKEEQTFTTKITNADALYNNGTISQVQRAQMLGYEEPDQDEPRQSSENNAGIDIDDDTNNGTDPDVQSNWRDIPWLK